MKRDYIPQGKSKWYYLDPRGASTLGSMKQIDVANENLPNPQLADILAYDMQENPQEYYVWRTKGDNKVRGAHAEREGKIFNKNIPPAGGNPGEDYNCRCYSEPYNPEEYKNKPMVVDVSGLDIFKEQNSADLNIKFLPQYAANDKATTATDAVYDLTQNMSDNELLNLMAHNLLATEKMKNYIYLDKFGHITSGVGALLDDEKAFKSVPLMIGDRLATEREIDDAYQMFTFKRFEKNENGEFKNHNRLAESFENECNLRVPEAYMVQRMMTHLKEDLTRAKRKRTDFDTYPVPLKLIILDFYYNKGSFYNQPGLPQALNARDAKLFQKKMVRHMADRDKWTQEQFNLIPKKFWKNY